MKKKSLSAKKTIHKKLLINLEDPLINKIYKDFNNFIKINLKNSNFSVATAVFRDMNKAIKIINIFLI